MNHRVVFIVDRGQPIAVPGRVLVKSGDAITFQSLGVGRVALLFPDGVLLPAAEKKPAAGGKLGRDEAKSFTVAGPPGAYTYVAYCRDLGDVALGGSQPKIIIYQ